MLRLISMVAMLVITACATAPPPAVPPTNGKAAPRLLSLSPESLGRSLSLSQIVTGEYSGKTYHMLYEVEITPARLAVVGLSPLGVTLFTLIQKRGESVTVTQLNREATFDPRYILFDLYLTWWPRAALQAALASLTMRLEESNDGSNRRIWSAGRELLAEIRFPQANARNKEIVIQHYDIPYRLRIRGQTER